MEELRKEFEKGTGITFEWDSNFNSEMNLASEKEYWKEFAKWIFEQKLSKPATEEELENFMRNNYDEWHENPVAGNSFVLLRLLKERIFSHYILIPKE
jgi:hypothetical protein